MKSTLIVFESIFCDYEFNPEVRQRFLPPWLASIKQLSRLQIPEKSTFLVVLYLSEDKANEISAVNDLLARLPDRKGLIFKVVTYQHPSEGYGYENATHPDLLKNPNKVAPQRNRLFERAIENLNIYDYSHIIRLALDDDDFLLEWQLNEIVRAAERAHILDKIVAVGMPNQIVSYIEPKRADVVSMTHQLNGTKFYVSSTELFEKQRKLSPWSIPEHFNTKNVARMAKAGVLLVTVQDNVPGLVYCRWGHNLSLHDKSSYYTKRFQSIEFRSTESMVSTLEQKLHILTETFREHSQPVIFHDPHIATPVKNSSRNASKYRIWAPENDSQNTGRIVAVFRSPTGTTKSSNLTHSNGRYLGAIPTFDEVEFDYVGYLQFRGNNKDRKQISARAQIRFVDQITKFSVEELLTPIEAIPEGRLRTFENSIGMLLWLDSPKSREHLLEFVEQIHYVELTTSQFTLLKYAFDVSRNAPNKFTSNVFSYLWSYQELRMHSGKPPIPVLKRPSAVHSAESTNLTVSNFQSEWADFQCIWDSVESFYQGFKSSNANGNQRISTPSYPIDIQIDGRKSKPLIVFLHGRKAPEVKLPYLTGAGITSGLDVSRLSISDPSLYIDSNLSIAWYTGSSSQPELQRDIVGIVKKVAAELEATRIIFVGGSAGGFASAVFSHQIEDSVALIWNPQTEVLKYYKKFVDSYLDFCWPGGTKSIPNDVVTSITKQYANNPSRNLVVYMQEDTDEHHIKEHLKPFKEAMALDNRILAFQSHWGEGHAPVPKPLLKEVLKACLEADIIASLARKGFRPL